MNKVLDLRFNGSLSKKNSIFFNNIINFNIKNFNILIESIFKNNDVKNNYFLTPGFSRNTLSSPIFHYYISSIFIKKYKKKIISYDVIFTDNYYHTKYIKFFLLKNNINKKFRFVQKNNLLFLFAKITIFNIIIIFKEFVYRICQFVFSNLSKKNYVKPIGLNNIIIIDKYIFPKYITKERYYNFLENNLPVNILNKIYYVPTIEYCKFNQIFYIFKKLRKNEKNLFKDDYISFIELLKIFANTFKILFIKYSNFENQTNLINLIKIDNYQLSNYVHPLIEGLKTKVFIKNLKAHMNVDLAINWYENNQKDKCWNMAFNTHHQTTKTKGYLGFFPSPNFLNISSPSIHEENIKILPNNICVIGKSVVSQISRFVKMTNTEIAPAFRFFYLSQIYQNKLQNKDSKNILVSLPILRNDSDKIFNDVKKIIKHFRNYKFLVMPHPTNIEYSSKYQIGDNLTIVENDIKKYLGQSKIVISGMSSICMEAISLNIPLIILSKNESINVSIVPNNINKKMFKRYFSSKGLLKLLKFYLYNYDAKENEKLSLSYYKDFFYEINSENSNKFVT